MNAWESICRMCDRPLLWSSLRQEWEHKNHSIYCPDKTASVATPGGEK